MVNWYTIMGVLTVALFQFIIQKSWWSFVEKACKEFFLKCTCAICNVSTKMWCLRLPIACSFAFLPGLGWLQLHSCQEMLSTQLQNAVIELLSQFISSDFGKLEKLKESQENASLGEAKLGLGGERGGGGGGGRRFIERGDINVVHVKSMPCVCTCTCIT